MPLLKSSLPVMSGKVGPAIFFKAMPDLMSLGSSIKPYSILPLWSRTEEWSLVKSTLLSKGIIILVFTFGVMIILLLYSAIPDYYHPLYVQAQMQQ
jgi:VIT1/CCC1 family predicted Fe2+/Mn2+ transporter